MENTYQSQTDVIDCSSGKFKVSILMYSVFACVVCVSQPRKIQRLMKQTTKVDILEHKNINQKYSRAKLKCEIYENYWIKLNK